MAQGSSRAVVQAMTEGGSRRERLRGLTPQSPLTGLAGGAVALAGVVLFARDPESWEGVCAPIVAGIRKLLGPRWEAMVLSPREMAVMGLVAVILLVMVVLEAGWLGRATFFRAMRRAGAGPPNLFRRVAVRWCALVCLLAGAWTLYALSKEHQLLRLVPGSLSLQIHVGGWYGPWARMLALLTVGLVFFSPLYLWCMHRFYPAAVRPWEDELLLFWSFLRRPSRILRPRVRNMLLGFAVKFFFIPVMTIFLFDNATHVADEWARMARWFRGNSMEDILGLCECMKQLFPLLFWSLLFVDVSLSWIGYLVSAHSLDTHIRTAEPTCSGWVAALLCYPPINRLSDFYLYWLGGVSFPQLTENSGTAMCLVTLGIFVAATGAHLLYTVATTMFGLRFSNLTHRGILTRGPYAWIRHPAYVGKNATWWVFSLTQVNFVMMLCWLTSAPYEFAGGVSVPTPAQVLREIPLLGLMGMVGWTGVYYLRAVTEERHLRRDPAYREYCALVRWKFIPGVW